MSLRTKLLLAVGLLAVAAVVAVALAARQGTREEFRAFQDIERRERSQQRADVSAQIAATLTNRCCDDGDRLREAAAALPPDHAFFVIDDARGAVIAQGGAALDQLTTINIRRARDGILVDATRDVDGVAARVTLQLFGGGAPLTLTSGAAAALHVLSFPVGDAPTGAAFLVSVDLRLFWATVLVAALALALTWTVAGRLVRPIEDLRRAAADLAKGDLARRVTPRGADEVAELGRTFNAMAEDLERQQTLRRDLVHDVVHELRTPLTALRCRLETAIDGLSSDPQQSLRELHDEVLHLSRLVDDLQEVALAEARELRLAIADVPLLPIVQSALRAAALEHDPRVSVTIVDSLSVRADPVRLRQVVLNIVTNAERHTPPDGRITISADVNGPLAVVRIHNTGSQLDSAQARRVFDRFYRTDPARQRSTGSAGLGLAIVKNLVEAQGGRVWADSDASGVTFGFELPASSP